MAAPIQSAQITKYPLGVSSFGMPLIGDDVPTTGRVFFVDSTSSLKGDDADHGTDPLTPFATLDFAIGKCSNNRGDRIYLLPGHEETLTSAAAVNCDVEGVQIFGLGSGRDRPYFTFATSTAATIAINDESVWIRNVVFDLTGIDALATAIDIKSNDARIEGCEFILATSGNQALSAITTDANCHRTKILGCLFAGSNNSGMSAVIGINCASAVVVDGIEIGWNRLVGDFSSGINVLATGGGSFSNLYIHDNTILTLGSAQAGITVTPDAATGMTGIIANNQIAGTLLVSLLVVNTAVAPYPALIGNKGYDSDTPNVNGVDIPVVGTSLPASSSLIDNIIGNEFSYLRANYLAVTVDFSSATWNTVATHEILTVTGAVRLRIIPVCGTDLTSGGAAELELGVEGDTDAFLGNTIATDIDAAKFWLDATPTAQYNKSAVIDRIVNGLDIGYEVTVAALTGGTIIFHCWWEPINSTGAVVPGAGGAL